MYKNWAAVMYPKGIDFDPEKLTATYGNSKFLLLNVGLEPPSETVSDVYSFPAFKVQPSQP